MESPSEGKRAIALKPSDTVLTAFPYRPHSTLLDLLRGEPKVLGAVQILLALIILGIGIIFLLSYLSFSSKFPIVFLTGYPFWGALIFFLAGCFTVIDTSKRILGLSVTTINIISSLVAVAGITLTIISYINQHRFCQDLSFEGLCAIGRTLLIGMLSVLLIISIVEFSVSVTITCFRSKCWTRSNEVVFFLPEDVMQNSEQPAPEENVQLKFELQEASTSTDATKTEIFFFGSYAFYKLKVSRIPSGSQPCNTGRDNYESTSASVPHGQHQNIPISFKYLEEDIAQKQLPPISEQRISDYATYTKPDSKTGKFKKVVKEYTMAKSPQMQTQPLQDKDFLFQDFLVDSVQDLQALPPDDLPSQALLLQGQQAQAMSYKSPSSHIIQSYDLTSDDLPSQDIPSQDTIAQYVQPVYMSSQDTPLESMLYQDIMSQETQPAYTLSQDTQSQSTKSQSIPSHDRPSQNTASENMTSQDTSQNKSQDTSSQYTPSQDIPSQALPAQVALYEALTPYTVQIPNTQHLPEQSPDLQPQDIQAENLQLSQISYQDIRSEVLELTQEWNYEGVLHGKKSPRRHSSDWQTKGGQSPRRLSLELQPKDSQTAKQKSKDHQIKGWLSPKRHSIDKKTQYTQTSEQLSDQQAEDQQAKVGQFSKEQSRDIQIEDQLATKEQSPNEKTQYQQTEDQQVREEKSPREPPTNWQADGEKTLAEKASRQPCQYWASHIQQHQDSQSPEEETPDWTTENWQSSGKQYQDWRNQDWQTRDWKSQEWQFEMQHSLNWETQAGQIQDRLEEEALKQKTLHPEVQTQHTTARYRFGQKLQDMLCQNSQNQDKNKQNFLFRFILQEDTQTSSMQARDIKQGERKYRSQKPVDQQSEDMKPDCHPSSSQSLAQDTHIPCFSNIGSEQDVQQNASVCSDSYKEDLNFLSSSCHSKDQQQSEESD
nr:membrane-spanning 4-domains subfamily A member 14 isoform X1 [Oryctolagus cuniculus]